MKAAFTTLHSLRGLVAGGVLLAASVTAVQAFDSGFTASTTSQGQVGVEACRGQVDSQLRNCVATALDQVANKMRRKPDYTDARNAFRQAATAVRQASSASAAASAVQSARSQLLRAGGQAASHHQQLAQVMDSARSVLRS